MSHLIFYIAFLSFMEKEACVTYLTYHMSHVKCQKLHVPSHTSYCHAVLTMGTGGTCHMSFILCHMSYVTSQMSHVTCQMAHSLCEITHFTCHMQHITSHLLLYIWKKSRTNVYIFAELFSKSAKYIFARKLNLHTNHITYICDQGVTWKYGMSFLGNNGSNPLKNLLGQER